VNVTLTMTTCAITSQFLSSKKIVTFNILFHVQVLRTPMDPQVTSFKPHPINSAVGEL
jgi:hypothetical protein